MANIKTKESVRKAQGGPKKLDRSLILADRMKNSAKKTGDYAKDVTDDGEVTPDEYAENRIKYAAEGAVGSTGRTVKRGMRYEKERRRKRLEKAESAAEEKAEESTVNNVKRTVKRNMKESETVVKQSVRNTEKTAGTVKNTRRTVHSVDHTVRTAEQTAKTIKTAEAAAKAAQKTAEASAKASRKAAEAARQAAIVAKRHSRRYRPERRWPDRTG